MMSSLDRVLEMLQDIDLDTELVMPRGTKRAFLALKTVLELPFADPEGLTFGKEEQLVIGYNTALGEVFWVIEKILACSHQENNRVHRLDGALLCSDCLEILNILE